MGGGEPSFDSPAIKPINKGAIHRICAGQVILDLSSAVKELVENSLDAGATSIEISLRDYGEESFQVIDNGCGISPNNFEVLALKHHTSKLTDFPDLQSLTTFGFRGEALSSLCALGDLTVETRTKSEQVATHLTFNHLGVLIAEKKTARQIGTTVTIKKLFSNLPVRSKEFHRNIRKEYGKLISLLNAYALVAKGVRLVCSNTTGRNAKSMVLNTQGSGSLKENIIAVFGMSTFTCLEPVSICISDACKVDGFLSKSGNGSGRNLGDRQYFFVNGRPVDMPKVSKLVNELYRGANSKQYPIAIMNFTVPTRACDVNVTPDKRKIFFSDEHSILQSLKEALENIYSPFQASYSVHKPEVIGQKQNSPKLYSRHELGSQSPLQKLSPCVSNPEGASGNERCPVTNAEESIRPLPAMSMINNDRFVTSKRDFGLRVHGINKADSFFGNQSELLTGDTGNATDGFGSPDLSVKLKDTCGKIISPCSTNMLQSSLKEFVTVNKRKHESISNTLSELPLLRNGSTSCRSMNEDCKLRNAFTRSSVCHNISDDSGQGSQQKEDSGEVSKNEAECSEGSLIEKHIIQSGVSLSSKVMKQLKSTGEDLEIVGKPTAADTSEITASPKNANNDLKEVLDTPPILSTGSKMCSTLQFSLDDLKARRQRRSTRLRDSNPTGRRFKIKRCYNAANLDLSQPVSQEGKERALAAATTELEKLFKKDDFGRMKVVGQFNLGFIIGKLDHDLFIVDQHAADEKYNFERLSQLTILNQQPLLRPLRMELSPQEEITVSVHMDIIRRNGFTLDEDVDAPPGQRFRLKAVPFSKNVTFGVADVKELISVLADSQGECLLIGSYKLDTPDSVCPPRVRAMLASRACRSSIMIGDPLGRSEMQKILEHLADLKSPWNCPHGRPTMRHLVDLTSLHKRLDDDDDDDEAS